MTRNPYTRAKKFITVGIAVLTVYLVFTVLMLAPALVGGPIWLIWVLPAGLTVGVFAIIGLAHVAGLLIDRLVTYYRHKEYEWESKHD